MGDKFLKIDSEKIKASIVIVDKMFFTCQKVQLGSNNNSSNWVDKVAEGIPQLLMTRVLG